MTLKIAINGFGQIDCCASQALTEIDAKEAQIMDIIKIAYKQELVGSNVPLAIHRKFGHIARLVIRVKGSHVIDPFRFVLVFSLLQLLLLFLWILTHWFPSPTAMLLFAFTGKFSIHEE